MKKFFLISLCALVSGAAFAQNDEGKPDESSKLIQSTQTQPNQNSQSIRTMKIQADEAGNEAKRKAFIDELRSLYKINFL